MINPNLPDKLIKTAIVSKCISQKMEFTLNEYGINVIKLFGNMNCDKAVLHHPDLYLMHCSRNDLFLAKNICSLSGRGFFKVHEIDIDLTDCDIRYPNDVFFNAVALGKNLICCKKYVHHIITEFSDLNGYRLINVNQGYTKCNICVVNERSVITEDTGIAKKLSDNNFDVLLLKNHCVKLDGYKYGFIGGASGKISEDKIAFLGNIKDHPEYEEIKRFLYKHDVIDVSLSDEPLTDFGSLVPII